MVYFPFLLALVGFGTVVQCQYGGDYGYGGSGYAAPDASASQSAAPSATPSAAADSAGPGSAANVATSSVSGGDVNGDLVCVQNMCISGAVQNNTVEYVMQSTGATQLGWLAMGFGTGMVGSPMVIMWSNSDGSVSLSQRIATQHSLPNVDPAPPRIAALQADITVTTGNQPVFAYSMPVGSNMKPNLIWACGTDTPSSSDPSTATWKQHVAFGTTSLDLTKTNNAAILAAPATSLTQSSASGQSSPHTPSGKSSAETVILAHAIFCASAFLLVMPAGALLARFYRTFSNSWFKGHWILQLGVGGPMTLIGAILAGSISRVGGPIISNTHTQVGILLFILYALQCSLGGVIHFIKPKKPQGRPAQNYAHAILGLTIIGLAFFQVRTGYKREWPNAVGRPAPGLVNLLWYIWVVAVPTLYAGGLLFLKKQYKKEKESRGGPAPPKRLSFEDKMYDV